MILDYGVALNARSRAVSFFVPSVSFPVQSPLVLFSISNSRCPIMLHFIFFYLPGFVIKIYKRLCRVFTNFHLKEFCILTSECNLKNCAPTHILR